MSFIPVNLPDLSGNEAAYLMNCVRSGWISSEGPYVKQLEDGLAARLGRKYGVAVSNGTTALDLAVAALGIGPGDEVILPTFTIISCAAAIVRAGATPVVVDCDPLTWNMDCTQVEKLISPRTRAIMVVHIYGLPVDMDPILALAQKYHLRVIEDAAEVIGQTYRGRPCGSFGDISTLSFYPNKHITTGEGGMVLTDSEELAERCRDLRNLCFGRKRRFVHEQLGWNFRMSNLQAAVGVAQLERLDQTIARKRQIGYLYDELLSDLPCQRPLRSPNYAENIYWVYGLVPHDSVRGNAEIWIQELAKRGIGCRPFFYPMHQQPVFRKRGWFQHVRCPVAERLAERGFYIPCGLGLTNSQQHEVAQAVRAVLASYS
ncbi:MAG: DegT/DnrJ/EryC1/StrS family aminotransferase [Verrucomicrobiae bacterium]|nr:DegT/DnrJ/EryC1/StrS family aminotransferase [Verrucomicrobiae bacterium]